MPITTKAIAALFALFVALIMGAWIILESAVRPGFTHLEIEARARNQARVEAKLDSMSRDLSARVRDYARWDDTYRFVGDGNPRYVRANFGGAWFSNYDVDLAVMSNDAGKILWTNGRNDAGAPFRDTLTAQAVLAAARAAILSDAPAVGVIWTSEGPMLFAATYCTRSNGGGTPRGLVVFGRRLSRADLSEQVQLNIALINAAHAPADLAAHFAALRDRNAETWSTPDAMESLIALRDARGNLVGAVLASMSRDISALASRTLALTMLLFAAMSAAAITALGFLLRAIVIRRIQMLAGHFNTQSVESDLAPYHAAPSSDEIGRLIEAYNELAARLNHAQAREREALHGKHIAAAADRMKSDFMANISHELRTPLNSVIGYAELIEEDLTDAGLQTSLNDLGRIRVAARHLLSLTNEILDLSNIEAGRVQTTPETFLVTEMLDSVMSAVKLLVQSHGNALNVELGPDLGSAYTDELRVRQCLTNLISNASNFTKDGKLDVRVRRLYEGDVAWLRVEVQDDGVGMSEDELAQMFEPFVQADMSIVRRFGGTGLGLAMTRKLAALLGGKIDAFSTKGRGSRFVLAIPIVLPEFKADADERGGRIIANG